MIKIDVTTDQIRAALERMVAAYGDLSPLMAEIGETMVQRTQDNISAGVSPDGTPFAPRSQTTLDAYARAEPAKVPAGGPLVLTGTMRDQIAYEAASDHVDWGSNAIQAAVMHFGAEQGEFGAWIGRDKNGQLGFSTLPWGDIPARPFLGIGPDDETAVLEVIEGWLQEVASG